LARDEGGQVVAKAARRRMPKRTSEQTRELMLRAAVDIIRERANATGDDVVAAALAHLRLTQVAQQATALVRAETGDHHATAITTGAIYQIWPSQADFQAELLFHIAERQATLVPGLATSILRFNQAAAEQVPLADVLLDTMEEVHRHYCEDPLFRVELSFMISAVDPRVQKSLAHRQAAFKATADRAWQALMDAYELRPRPPFHVRDLTNAVAAVITGSVVIWFADAEGLADPAGEENRSLTGRTILAIFEHFTEPAT
jgi:hypothetical protein